MYTTSVHSGVFWAVFLSSDNHLQFPFISNLQDTGLVP